MTFDDWWGAYPTQEDYEANCRDAWEAGAASRRAEVAALVVALDAMHNDSDECMDFDKCTGMFVPIDEWNAVFEALAKVRKL